MKGNAQLEFSFDCSSRLGMGLEFEEISVFDPCPLGGDLRFAGQPITLPASRRVRTALQYSNGRKTYIFRHSSKFTTQYILARQLAPQEHGHIAKSSGRIAILRHA